MYNHLGVLTIDIGLLSNPMSLYLLMLLFLIVHVQIHSFKSGVKSMYQIMPFYPLNAIYPPSTLYRFYYISTLHPICYSKRREMLSIVDTCNDFRAKDTSESSWI